MPWYGWALLIFFGFDDMLSLIMSPYIVIVIALIGAFVGFWKTNNLHLLKNVYFEAENYVNKIKKLIINKLR